VTLREDHVLTFSQEMTLLTGQDFDLVLAQVEQDHQEITHQQLQDLKFILLEVMQMEPHVYFPSCTEEETIQDAPEQHMLGIGVVQPATMMLTISGGTVLQQDGICTLRHQALVELVM